MKSVLLGLETSGTATGLALVSEETTLFETVLNSNRGHNETIPLLLNEALTVTGLKFEELTGICITIGPGMFTALRVGLSFAKGLAVAHRLPLKGINTLLALGWTAARENFPVLALIDARKEEVYAGIYYRNETLISDTLVPIRELPLFIRRNASIKGPLLLAGNGTPFVLPFLREEKIEFKLSDVNYPSAALVACIGGKLLFVEGPDKIDLLEPRYIRKTDAELKRTKGPPAAEE